jgi:WD40 repeat protein
MIRRAQQLAASLLLAIALPAAAQKADVTYFAVNEYKDMEFKPEAAAIFVGDKGRTFGVNFDRTSGALQESVPLDAARTEPRAVAIGEDFAAVATESEILLFAIPELMVVQRHPLPVGADPVIAMAASPNGKHLVVALEGELLLHSLEHGILAARYTPEGLAKFTAVAASNEWLIAGLSDGTINIYELATGSFYTRLRADESSVTSLSISADRESAVVLAGYASGAVSLINAQGGGVLARIAGNGAAVRHTAVTPRASVVAFAREGGSIELLDGLSGASLGTLPTRTEDLLRLKGAPETTLAAITRNGEMITYSGTALSADIRMKLRP